MRIVVDAMGGDGAPEVEIDGAVRAVKEFDYDVALVGAEDILRPALEKYDYPKNKVTIINATQVIEMGEPAALSVRRKRNSSIVVALELLKKKEAE